MKCITAWTSPIRPSSPSDALAWLHQRPPTTGTAIDLIDEAASRIRMEIDSKPEELDRLERRIIQLKIEREALKKESDEASKKRLQTLDDSLRRWKRNTPTSKKCGRPRRLRAGRRANQGRAGASAAGTGNGTASAGSGRMSELAVRPDSGAGTPAGAGHRRTARTQLLRNKVTDEEVAEVVSKWTGIPVSKMLEGEKEKLLHMEEALGARRRPERSGARRVRCDPPLARRLVRSEPARTAPSCSWARRASARPSCARRSPNSSSTPKRRWCASTCRSSWRSTRSRA